MNKILIVEASESDRFDCKVYLDTIGQMVSQTARHLNGKSVGHSNGNFSCHSSIRHDIHLLITRVRDKRYSKKVESAA